MSFKGATKKSFNNVSQAESLGPACNHFWPMQDTGQIITDIVGQSHLDPSNWPAAGEQPFTGATGNFAWTLDSGIDANSRQIYFGNGSADFPDFNIGMNRHLTDFGSNDFVILKCAKFTEDILSGFLNEQYRVGSNSFYLGNGWNGIALGDPAYRQDPQIKSHPYFSQITIITDRNKFLDNVVTTPVYLPMTKRIVDEIHITATVKRDDILEQWVDGVMVGSADRRTESAINDDEWNNINFDANPGGQAPLLWGHAAYGKKGVHPLDSPVWDAFEIADKTPPQNVEDNIQTVQGDIRSARVDIPQNDYGSIVYSFESGAPNANDLQAGMLWLMHDWVTNPTGEKRGYPGWAQKK